MPLTMANIGETNTIKRVSGNDETKRFLANLGFVPGAEVIVLSAIGGNVIVNIKDSRNRKRKILLEGFCPKKLDRKSNKCYIGKMLEEVDVRERRFGIRCNTSV